MDDDVSATINKPGKRGRFHNPGTPPRRQFNLWVPVPLLEKLAKFQAVIYPEIKVKKLVREYLLPQFEDWLDLWLELKAPPEGQKISIERVRVFTEILHQKKRRKR